LFNRYVYDEWGKTAMTIGAYFGYKQIKVNGQNVNLAIWDTAGEEKFDSITNFYCRSARAAVVCYDITDPQSLKDINKWIDKIKNEAQEDCAILIVGNKCDLEDERKVDLAAAKSIASSFNATVVEASAKTGTNVPLIFEQVVKTSCERQSSTLSGGSTKNHCLPIQKVVDVVKGSVL